MHVFALQYAQRDTARDAGIDRIAAGLEDLESDLRGKIIRGCNHVPRADDARMVGGHDMLVGHSAHLSFCGSAFGRTEAAVDTRRVADAARPSPRC